MKIKTKIILVVFLLSLLGALLSIPATASEGLVPGLSEAGPFGRPTCACDYYPNDCWCLWRY